MVHLQQESHVRCIYKIHADNPIDLENEPKLVDPKKLIKFRIKARNARDSILGHNKILWRNGDMCLRSNSEIADLGIEDDEHEHQNHNSLSRGPDAHSGDRNGVGRPALGGPTQASPRTSGAFNEREAYQLPTTTELQQEQFIEDGLLEMDSLDFFRPFHDPEMLDLFPNGQPMEFSYMQPGPTSLDFCDLWPSIETDPPGLI